MILYDIIYYITDFATAAQRAVCVGPVAYAQSPY